MINRFAGKDPNVAKSTFVSEAASIIGDVEISEDCIVFPGAVIRGDFARIRIGRHVCIEDNCVLHAGPNELTIGSNVIIGHGAVVNCHCIGNNVSVCMNATLLHKAEVGNNCIIGADTLVKEGMKVPDNSFVAGVPGKIKGRPSKKQSWWIERAPETISKLIEKYKSEES